MILVTVTSSLVIVLSEVIDSCSVSPEGEDDASVEESTGFANTVQLLTRIPRLPEKNPSAFLAFIFITCQRCDV